MPTNSNEQKHGHTVGESDDILVVECQDGNNAVIAMQIRAPEWDMNEKMHNCSTELLANGDRLALFEPIVLKFHLTDPRTNFWFFSNRCAKTTNHEMSDRNMALVNALKLDGNYFS